MCTGVSVRPLANRIVAIQSKSTTSLLRADTGGTLMDGVTAILVTARARAMKFSPGTSGFASEVAVVQVQQGLPTR